MNFEKMPSKVQDLKFNYLEEKLKKHIQIETFNKDIL